MVRETTEQRAMAVARFRARRNLLHPPAVIDRAYLILGYVLYTVLGLAIYQFGAPALATATSETYTAWIGIIVAVLASVCFVASFSDKFYILEGITSILMASAMASYSASAIVSVFPYLPGYPGPLPPPFPGVLDDNRVVFAVVVFIITAVLWARGLTLVLRWIHLHVRPRGVK